MILCPKASISSPKLDVEVYLTMLPRSLEIVNRILTNALNAIKKKDEENTETGDPCLAPFHSDAVEALNITSKWFERQDESYQIQRIRDLFNKRNK